ncbi:phosphatase PAP2 family protein [Pseudobutyrivibrio sp.]|uniref:phosphatase PAP2 family protein n=1 Tax=Pseudobutyrivibrio sp. TaxID=2014367 RepID=UPI0025CD7642|nr:phosphatase PAP2 family protein [Pseudobutyrivibrio sp.]
MKSCNNKSITLKTIIMVLLALGFNCITYYGTRLITGGFYHHNMSTKLDLIIPLVPWTIIIYLGCYLFWIANYWMGSIQDEDETAAFLCADLCAKIVCFILFITVPTTIVRPEIPDTDIMNKAMLFLYSIDTPDNLFPSIHCLTSWFCVIAVRKQKTIPDWYKVLSVIIALAICVSTLTTKQHVVVDTFAGIALAELAYLFVKKSGILGPYKKLVSAIESFIISICKGRKQ